MCARYRIISGVNCFESTDIEGLLKVRLAMLARRVMFKSSSHTFLHMWLPVSSCRIRFELSAKVFVLPKLGLVQVALKLISNSRIGS